MYDLVMLLHRGIGLCVHIFPLYCNVTVRGKILLSPKYKHPSVMYDLVMLLHKGIGLFVYVSFHYTILYRNVTLGGKILLSSKYKHPPS